jgi:hypothetical protein
MVYESGHIVKLSEKCIFTPDEAFLRFYISPYLFGDHGWRYRAIALLHG